MVLKQSLTAEAHAALPEGERGYYKEHEGVFVPDIEGVVNLPGIVSTYQKERSDKEALQKWAKPFQDAGVTFEEITELRELKRSSELGKLTSKGEYDEAKKRIEADAQAKVEDANRRATEKMIMAQQQLALINAGVKRERLEDAMLVTRPTLKLGQNDSLVMVIPDAAGQPTDVNFDEYLAGDFKTKKAWYFEPGNGNGTGADPNNKGGGAKQTKTRAEFRQLDGAGQLEYSKLVQAGKAELVD